MRFIMVVCLTLLVFKAMLNNYKYNAGENNDNNNEGTESANRQFNIIPE